MNSIRAALMRRILVGVLCALAVSGAGTYVIARSSLRSQQDESLLARAETFAALVTEEPIEGNASGDRPGSPPFGPLVFDFKGSLQESDLGLVLSVVGPAEVVLARSPEWPLVVPADLVKSFERGQAGTPWTHIDSVELADGTAARVAAIARHANLEMSPRLEDGAERIAEGGSKQMVVVAVAMRLGPTVATERTLLVAIAAGVAVAVLGAFVAVLFGVTRGLAPLTAMARELDAVDPSEPVRHARAERWPAELAPIDSAINVLIRRIRETVERERRFVDAAAHELRTPLAELRTVMDVASRWPTDEHRAKAIEQARGIGLELEELIESLLALSRGQVEEAPQATTPIPLLSMAIDIVATLRIDPERSVPVQTTGDTTVRWALPRASLAAILRNLIDNAIAYTEPGGAVTISVAVVPGGSRLRIENGPVSLRPADIERMSEPFWRGDTSRTDRAHRGLGLAIVEALSSSLHIERSRSLEEGQVFRVDLFLRDAAG